MVSGPGYGKKNMVCLLDKRIEKGCIDNDYHHLRGPKSDHIQAARCIEQQKNMVLLWLNLWSIPGTKDVTISYGTDNLVLISRLDDGLCLLVSGPKVLAEMYYVN